MKKVMVAAASLLFSAVCFANNTDSIPVNQQDVVSVDAIIKSVYTVISGPAGEKRNWDRFRTLFVPEALMIATGKWPNGTYYRRSMTVEDYISASGPFLEKSGFFENEIGRKTEQYGNIVQVFSTYESRKAKEEESPFMRGINSIQLWYDGRRWWVINILWQSENEESPIPEKYIGNQ